MVKARLPYLDGGWWVVYDHTLVRKFRRSNMVRTVIGATLLIFAFVSLYLFLLPFGAMFKTQPVQSYQEVAQEVPQEKLDLHPVNTDFALVIPKLDINVPVFANVDIETRNSFEPFLTRGVAQAQGTSLPDEHGSVFIFGHSSDYPWLSNPYATVFLPIKNLAAGDKVYLVYKNNAYIYLVKDQNIVNAKEISYLNPHSDKDQLLLQTCWPPGTDWQRLIVTATLDKSQPI